MNKGTWLTILVVLSILAGMILYSGIIKRMDEQQNELTSLKFKVNILGMWAELKSDGEDAFNGYN